MISHWMEWGAKCCKHTSKIFQVIPSQAKTAWGLWAKTVSRKPNAFFTTAAAGCLMPTSQFPAEGIFLGSSPSPNMLRLHHPFCDAVLVCYCLQRRHQSPVTHCSPIETAALRTLQDICKLDFKIFPDISSAFPCFPSCSTGEFFSRPDRQNRSFPQNWALVWPRRRPDQLFGSALHHPSFVGPLGIPKTIKNSINSRHIPHYGKKKGSACPLFRLFWAFLAPFFLSNSKHQSTTQLKPLG